MEPSFKMELYFLENASNKKPSKGHQGNLQIWAPLDRPDLKNAELEARTCVSEFSWNYI